MSSCSNFESQMCSLLKQILAVLQTQGSELLGDVANITESVVPGVGSDDLGKEEDAPHASGDTGVMMLGVRNDANIALTDANFDYSPISVDSAGRIKFDGTSFTIGNIGSITTSVTPGTAAANLGKAEDAAHTTGDVGVFALAVRNDASVAFSGANFDYTPIAVTSSGKVFIEPGSSADSLGKAEDSGHTSGDVGVQMLAVRNDALASFSGANLDYTPIAVTSSGQLRCTYEYAEDSGHNSGDQGAFPLAVRNDTSTTLTSANLDYSPFAVNLKGATFVDVNMDYALSQANSILKLEDNAHSTGHAGVMPLAVRNDASATIFTDADLDYSPIAVDNHGAIQIAIQRSEDAVHTSGDPGIQALAVIQETLTASAAVGDYGSFKINTLGAQWVRPQIATVLSAGGSVASSGNNTLIAAGTNRLKVSSFLLSTVSATAMTCIFQSGAGGTELYRVVLMAPAGSADKFGLAVPVPAWLFATASATLLNLNISSANAVMWSCTYVDEA